MTTGCRSACLAALTVSLVTAGPGQGVAKQERTRPLKAVISGATSLTPTAPGVFAGASEGSIRARQLGDGTYRLRMTARAQGDGGWAVEGRFKVIAADGDKLRGTLTGTVEPASDGFAVRFRDRVTGGTGRFAGAEGQLSCRGLTRIVSVDPDTGAIGTSDSGTWTGRLRF